jgi:hypothetical protein
LNCSWFDFNFVLFFNLFDQWINLQNLTSCWIGLLGGWHFSLFIALRNIGTRKIKIIDRSFLWKLGFDFCHIHRLICTHFIADLWSRFCLLRDCFFLFNLFIIWVHVEVVELESTLLLWICEEHWFGHI